MKSTLKIDYERSLELSPIIKIIIPFGSPETIDEDYDDPRDKLIKDFLHTPLCVKDNWLFEIKSRFVFDEKQLTTISAIREEKLFDVFESAILSRLLSEIEHIECDKHYNYEGVGSENNAYQTPAKYNLYYGIKKCFEMIRKAPYSSDYIHCMVD